jgi:hypothetical protein
MMPELFLLALLTSVTFLVLAAVYLWSKDAARRSRAWRLLKLLFRD